MKSSNADKIKQSFTLQSNHFKAGKLNFSDKEYLDFMITHILPQKGNTVLEVAAGTCACGIALAPLVRNVTCLDMTSSMLNVGKENAEKQGLKNMAFVLGDAEKLPFLNSSFDIVISRLAFHHFPDVNCCFNEMVRVLRPNGKLIIIDMEAAEEKLRRIQDKIETVRDPSHIRNLSMKEMLELYSKHSFKVEICKTTEIPISAGEWLDFTETSVSAKQELMKHFDHDISGTERTGFYPYQTDKEIYFNQRWILIIGRKT